jgi:hypothetical protein
MWFDVKRALAEIRAGVLAKTANSATNLRPRQLFVATVAKLAASPAQITESAPMPAEITRLSARSPHSISTVCHHFAWKERVVSLDA